MKKLDETARELWGGLYDAFPKSVFAAVAWRLVDRNRDKNKNAAEMFVEEARALADRGIMTRNRLDNAIWWADRISKIRP